jgi:beta-glucosidase-like glycosyl hydrolase
LNGLKKVITTASSFNASLFRAIGVAISTEARAMNNAGQAGLTYWAPNVNIFRDPRWGRGQETPGEDPKLTSVYAREFVRGMQFGEEKWSPGRAGISLGQTNSPSNTESNLKVSACCKHYWGYDVENFGSFTRYTLDVAINTRDAKETFLPPFEACVKDAQVRLCSLQLFVGMVTQ